MSQETKKKLGMTEKTTLTIEEMRAALADVKKRQDEAWRVYQATVAEEETLKHKCPHVDREGRPTTRRSWSDPGRGWCDVCLRGFILDDQKRVVGPWK